MRPKEEDWSGDNSEWKGLRRVQNKMVLWIRQKPKGLSDSRIGSPREFIASDMMVRQEVLAARLRNDRIFETSGFTALICLVVHLTQGSG